MFWGFGRKSAPSGPNLAPYQAYTTQFDQVLSATELRKSQGSVMPAHLLNEVREPTPARMRATRRSMAFQSCYRAGHELGERSVFTLLIDHSGSMRGPKAMAAAVLADVAGAILEHEHVLFDILGFTTSSWRGGYSRQKWKSRGSPESPGRPCDLFHIVYADAQKPDRSWPNNLPFMLLPETLKENVDGEALLWAKERAMSLDPPSWVCVLVSDGVPMDDSTVPANGGDKNGWYLYRHLTETIAELGADPRIRLGYLSLEYDVAKYFFSTRRVDSLENSATIFFDLVEDLIWSPAPKSGPSCLAV